MRTPAAFVLMLALAAVGSWALLGLAPAHRDPAPPPPAPPERVLAGHPATLALAHALAARTPLEIAPAWPAGTLWAETPAFAREAPAEWQAAARRATAVVTLRHAARSDALYPAVRALNARAIELDASVAADLRTPTVRLRATGEENTSFTLAPTNAMRLAERLAAEFVALQPAHAAAVADNLRAVKERLLRLKARHDAALAHVAALEVAAFSADFDHLCEEFGIRIVAHFDPEQPAATADARTTLAAQLRRAQVRVSLHSFPPAPELAAVLAAAGIKPVVLDPLTRAVVSPEAFFEALDGNLAQLATAFGP